MASLNKLEWEKVVKRGAIILPSYELFRNSGDLYAMDANGNLDETKIVGKHPNLYLDKSFADYHYYSFTALIPDKDVIGLFEYQRFDEDKGIFEDDIFYSIEIDNPYDFETEKEYLRRMKGVAS